MNITSRIFFIWLSLSLFVLILELVRKRRLKEKYAILWLISASLIFVFSVFTKLLYWITSILGIGLPSNTIFLFGILFIVLINLHFSLVVSNLSEQIKKLAQKLTLLEFELSNKKNLKNSHE